MLSVSLYKCVLLSVFISVEYLLRFELTSVFFDLLLAKHNTTTARAIIHKRLSSIPRVSAPILTVQFSAVHRVRVNESNTKMIDKIQIIKCIYIIIFTHIYSGVARCPKVCVCVGGGGGGGTDTRDLCTFGKEPI